MVKSEHDIGRVAIARYPKDKNLQRAFIDGYLKCLSDSGSKKHDSDFFVSVATALRELWPPGEKDGKYPWRDSISNLAKRLEFIWKERNLGDKYTVDNCVMAANRYLNNFQNNTKYMKILKYFIFKQNSTAMSSGKMMCTYSSTLVDYLESNPVSSSMDNLDSVFDFDYEMSQGNLV